MAISPGYQSKVWFVADADSSMAPFSVDNITVWTVDRQREMVDVTPLASEGFEFVPNTEVTALTIRGFIDQSVDPGGFNDLLATVEIIPDQREGGTLLSSLSGKKMSFSGWVEKFRWFSSVEGANEFEAVIRASGGVIYNWSNN